MLFLIIFFVNLLPHSFSFQYDKHVFYCKIKIAWVAGFAFKNILFVSVGLNLGITSSAAFFSPRSSY